MIRQKNGIALPRILVAILALLCGGAVLGRTPTPTPTPKGKAPKAPSASFSARKSDPQDDSTSTHPAHDLLLAEHGRLKADALSHYMQGQSFEENGELEKALAAYRQVLNVDPGQADLASRVAALLARQDDFPGAIDVLKDAIKANPKAAEPYLQLAFIYAKYLKKMDQAIEYVNRAINLDPTNIDAYQRLFEVEIAAGDEKKARQALERATTVQSSDPTYWTRLGKIYAAALFKPDRDPSPNDIARVNEMFQKAAKLAQDDPAVLKEVADFYASTQQIQEAIPLYLRVLELQPDDANAREKLATGFILTNQRAKAIDLLEQVIKDHPDKYQSYDLLAQVLDDQGRALQRDGKTEEARAAFTKAAANYEQSLLVNPGHATTYVRLAELLLGAVKDPERAVRVLTEARRRFPETAEMIYYLAVALREAKHTQEAVTTFEEAMHEAEIDSSSFANARFFFDYGATAEQAGLYDKAADLFKKAISLDPGNSSEARNYLAYMWADQNTHLDEALDMIQRALEGEPNNGAFLDTLAWVEYRQGKFDQALTDVQRAMTSLGRPDAVVSEHLGDILLKLDRPKEAIEAWSKARDLDPKNRGLADKIEGAKAKMK